jgi:3-oxoacyl-[acyl-carrier protein] reductase
MCDASTPFVVFVTGGTRGIGLAVALECARRGAIVAMGFANNVDAANAALQLVANEAARVRGASVVGADAASAAAWMPSIHKGDLGVAAECSRVFADVLSRHGRCDALVNNAGICKDHDVGNVADVDFAAFSSIVGETMRSNFESAANLSFLAVRHFLARDGSSSGGVAQSSSAQAPPRRGVLVHVTSRAAVRGELTCAGYAASKAALSIFGQSLARRFAGQGVFSFVVAPGWVLTDLARGVLEGPERAAVLAQHPLGRVATAEEVATAICFCAFDAPPAMTGTVIDVNGASYLR